MVLMNNDVLNLIFIDLVWKNINRDRYISLNDLRESNKTLINIRRINKYWYNRFLSHHDKINRMKELFLKYNKYEEKSHYTKRVLKHNTLLMDALYTNCKLPYAYHSC
jgi:hypothetical protein